MALRLWQEVLEDPESDRVSLAIATRQVRDLQVRIQVGELQAAIDRFRTDNGRNPLRLEELAARASDPAIKEKLKVITDGAVARGVFGAPTFFVGEEMYFGQDRLDYVELALAN